MTTTPQIVYESAEGRVRVERVGREFDLFLDGQYAGTRRTQSEAEHEGAMWLAEQARRLAADLADEQAARDAEVERVQHARSYARRSTALCQRLRRQAETLSAPYHRIVGETHYHDAMRLADAAAYGRIVRAILRAERIKAKAYFRLMRVEHEVSTAAIREVNAQERLAVAGV